MQPDRRAFLTASAALATAGTAVPARAEEVPDNQLGRTRNTKMAVNVEMWWSRERDYLKRLENAAALGFPAIEMWPWRGRNINAIAETCERLKLQIAQFTGWGFTPGMNDPKNHSKLVEEIEAGCETAKKLKCKMMCVVGGNDIPGMSQQQMHENIIEGLRKVAPIAEKHDVTLILEAMNIRVDHKGHCLYGSAPTARILKAVGSKHVKMLYDAYHMHITEGDLCGHLREFFDLIAYIQVADHPGRNEPGTGEIHYPRVFKELKTLGYTGWVGLECRPLRNEVEAARAVNRADNW